MLKYLKVHESCPLLFYVEFIYLSETRIEIKTLLFDDTDLCIFLAARHGITLLFYANGPTNLNFRSKIFCSESLGKFLIKLFHK